MRLANRAARGHFDFGLDNVLSPITAAGGDVPRQRETRQAGHGDIVRSSNARFEHASAPERDAVFQTDVVHLARAGVPTNSAQFDIHDPART